MMDDDTGLESQIGQWRGYVQRHRTISAADVEEMESHLRDRVADLTESGLTEDEAFLVAVKRIGNVDEISREFAREHSDRLWNQLVLMPSTPEDGHRPMRELGVVLALAVGAALAVRAGVEWLDELRLVLNAPLLVLPFLTAYFAWKRQVTTRVVAALLEPFALAAAVVNAYPFDENGSTVVIAVIHTPIVLWFAVGVAYVGGAWRSDRRRMDFIRFTGEWVVYMVLLALGGGVLIGLTVGTFNALGMDPEWFIAEWVAPMGAAGAVLVAAWLVEAKQNVVENIAPVLTRVFTPLTNVMMLALLGAFTTIRSFTAVDRDLLILMDLVLVLVLGLLLYAISARDPQARPGAFEWLQLVLVVSAVVVDLLMLVVMLTRIAEFGFTANKTVALGLNLVLLVNLVWSARIGVDVVRGRRGFAVLERWQTQYLPVFGAWAALVALAIPPIFGFD